LVGLEVHLFSAADEPCVVEAAGVAEVEAALLLRERGDEWPSDDGEAEEREEAGNCCAGCGAFLPDDGEGDESENAEKCKEEGERFCEIGKAEGDAHEGGVAELVGGEML